MKLCAVVITYYPNNTELINNINQYISCVDHLLIWDNTPAENRMFHLKNDYKHSDKITYLTSGKNVGIATALNNASEWGLRNGYTHLLTMDQDSKWVNFHVYKQEIEKLNDECFSAFAPLIHDIKRNKTGFNTELQFITSGSIYNLRALKKIGGFCREFFIDNVDTEFALRLRYYGLKVKIIQCAQLNQSFGNIKKIKFLGCYHAHYSSFRLYHIIRNNIWTWRMYKKTKLLPKRFLTHLVLFKYLIREPLLIIISGNDKISKFKYLFKGLIDGLLRYPNSLNQYLR